jgi:hypothetical protein
MRLAHSVALARMLLLFFSRRVLRMGVLRSTPVRVVALTGVAALLLICSAAAYYFLRPLAENRPAWRMVFDTSTVSLVLWAQVAFLFVKILFLNAEGLLELSFQLPLTNRERSVAFMMYEACVTGIVVVAGTISLTASALLLLGPAAVPRLLESIIFPVVLTYLALTIVYQVLARLCTLLRLRTIANILVLLAMFGLQVTYSAGMTPLVSALSENYLDGVDRRFVWVTSVSWASRRYGSIAALAGALLIVMMLTLLALLLSPSRHVRHSRYVNVPVGPWLRRTLGPYDWCLLRNSQTMVGAAVAVPLFAYLTLDPAVNPMWSLSVLSLGGLYQFAATQPLRVLVGSTSSPWRTYALLIRAQVILLALFAVPALVVLGVVDQQALAKSPSALAGCFAGAILSSCIGIVFPAEKDNPFSVFIGLSLTGVVLGLTAIGLGILQLPASAVLGSLVGALALSIWYAVHGIEVSESRRRNEKGTTGSELRRRVRGTDLGDRSDGPALSYVLNR